MKRFAKVIAVVVTIGMITSKLYLDYSCRILDFEMDMCDEKGNVIHVAVDGILYRKSGKRWRLEGKICYGSKVFVNRGYDQDGFVREELKVSQDWSWPDEWISSFSVADIGENTYYFMVYQLRGSSKNHWDATENNTFSYFGPASRKEEAEKIRRAWVQRE